MIEIEDGIKLSGVGTKARAKHHAKNLGSFVRAGCSIAPSPVPKVKEARTLMSDSQIQTYSEPYMLFARRLKTNPIYAKLKAQAVSMGIPSSVKS